jgi:hypothetical protein
MKYIIEQSKLIELVVSMINPEIEEYSIHEQSGQYALNNREGKCILNYIPDSKELYYDHSLFEYISKFIPIGYDTDTFKEGVKEYFNSQFPDLIVRGVYGANIVSF